MEHPLDGSSAALHQTHPGGRPSFMQLVWGHQLQLRSGDFLTTSGKKKQVQIGTVRKWLTIHRKMMRK
jgi:hypothetical protein